MPITIFKGVQHSNLFPDALFTAAWELVIFGPFALASIWVVQRFANVRKPTPRMPSTTPTREAEAENTWQRILKRSPRLW